MDITVYKRGKGGKKLHDEAKTKIIQVKFKERNIDIEKKIYIGRNMANAISIKDDPLVSRKHAVIEHVKGCYYISDLSSTNGTYVNNHPVTGSCKVSLKSEDIIRVGKTELSIV